MKMLQVDGYRLNTISAGSGAPLLFVHGSAGGARQWKAMYEHFAATRRVIAYDLVGCGRNEPLPITPPSGAGDGASPAPRPLYEEDTRAVLAAIRAAGAPADVIAHSGGCLGVVLAALQEPEAIRSLTLFEPVLFVLLRDAGDPAFEPVRHIATEYRIQYECNGPASAMQVFVDFWNGPGCWQRLPRPVQTSMLAGASRLYVEWTIALHGQSYLRLSDLRKIRQPLIQFCGTETIGPAKRLTEMTSGQWPRGRLVTVATAGHMLPFTHAPQVIPIVQAHLDQAAIAAE